MNRRKFIGAAAGAVAATAWATNIEPQTIPEVQIKGPYSIEIVSPPEHASRELPLFDSYKQAENFAQARMNLLRMEDDFNYSYPRGINTIGDHEAGLIRVWANHNETNHQIVFECAWGETWTSAYSYVDAKGRLA
jgi:hypothetical protein